MQKILVDSGNSANLLQMSAYRQMGYLPYALENPGRLISRFNGTITTSLGDIVLPVQVGSVTLSVQFLVVDDLSPCNAIMGHVWIHKMKLIPPTYHQMVSYLTKAGQIDFLGSQLVAQQCYQVALEFEHSIGEETHLEPSNTREQ